MVADDHLRASGCPGSTSPFAAPRSLEHTGVAFLAEAGVDPSEIAGRAGHAEVAFTYDHNGHLLPEVNKGAATKLDRLREQSRT
jgi:hypothetical protein